jgi:hypothetical protein
MEEYVRCQGWARDLVCRCGALSLTGVRVCRLKFLLLFAGTITLGAESRGTNGYILLSQVRDFLKLEGYTVACRRVLSSAYL